MQCKALARFTYTGVDYYESLPLYELIRAVDEMVEMQKEIRKAYKTK